MKKLKLEEGDFFHVKVVESEDGDAIKLKAEDGPLKGRYLYLDLISNPYLEEEEEIYNNYGEINILKKTN